MLLQAGRSPRSPGSSSYLFAALGARIRRRRVLAVTLARTAISISVPAGAAVSTGYAIREYERGGVPKEIGAVTAIVSGLASIGGLALVYVGGGAALLGYGTTTSLTWRPLVVVAAVVGLTAAAVLLGRPALRHGPMPSATAPRHRGDDRAPHRVVRPPVRQGRVRRYVRDCSPRPATRGGPAPGCACVTGGRRRVCGRELV